ncbi:restriction endonuclease subunit S [Pseudomonas putida]|uniref:restriction endonuclease subunit S n=1 Tax=Pseudomonas putida TaxID=303 RepID=UPI0018D8F2A1|nr:restriction endonuclease subunit S [Pseudomonas putida]MBH3462589.1 restriction endonuclease subunit S [Pseudomonas putida]
MSFPAYPAYKDSGVDWLGEIPERWGVKPLWALFRRHKLTGFPDEQLLSVYRDYGVIPKASRDDNFNKPSDDLGAYQLVQIGDLVINKMKAWQGSVGISSHRGIVSPAYHVYAPSHSEVPQYLHYLFRCNEYIAGYLASSKGIRVNQWDLEPQQHSRMSVLLPSFQEQTQIARFLDQETARIDALIEEQQRLIELLKEKRQTVISHAVTKGLDLEVPMKDCGVEWLGQVPAHWVISQLKFNTVEMQTGPFGSQLHAEDYIEGGVPLVNPAHMVDGKIIPDPQVSVDEITWQRLKRHALTAGDIIFARRGELGRCAIVTDEHDGWLCGTGSLKAKLNAQLDVEYAYLLITSKGAIAELSLESKGSTMDNLNTETLGRIRLPLPPVSEQKAILEYVHEVSGRFGALVEEAESGIRLITERRSALISAAVTGKIDVLGWQPPASAPTPELAVAEVE